MTTTTDWQRTIRRYRLAMAGSVLGGMAGLFLGVRLGYPVVGVGLYWAGVLGFLGVKRYAPVTLFDERDCELERRASYRTLNMVAAAVILGAPASAVVEEVGVYDTPAVVEAAIWGYVALAGVFALNYAWLRYGR